MLKRQRTGSIVCPGCGYLVGVNDQACYNCGRWNPSLWGFSPIIRRLGHDMGFVQLIMVGSIGLYVGTLFVSTMLGQGLGPMLSPSSAALVAFGGSGAYPLFGLGHWWSLLSAGWLHGGALHILFNMLWVRQLAPETAELYGPGRTVIIYTVAGVVGFLMSSVMGLLLPGVPLIGGARLTVGASAPIFGLLGALVHYGRATGSSHVGSTAWQYAIVLFVFGLIGVSVDNWAHAGGFAGGYLASMSLNPSRPERVDHLVAALVCLVATAASIAASLLFILPYLL